MYSNFEVKHLDKGKHRWAIMRGEDIVWVYATQKVAEKMLSNAAVCKQVTGQTHYMMNVWETTLPMKFYPEMNKWI